MGSIRITIPNDQVFPSPFCCLNHCSSPHMPDQFVPIRADSVLRSRSEAAEPDFPSLFWLIPKLAESRPALWVFRQVSSPVPPIPSMPICYCLVMDIRNIRNTAELH